MRADHNHTSPESESPAHASFVPAARVVAFLTVLSRFAGLARDALCSRIFGAGPVWSAFALAFLIPNLFRRLFGEGALSAALIPEYTARLKEDPDLAGRVANATLAIVLIALGALTLLGEAALLLLLQTSLAENGGLTIRLAMVMLPYMVLICATGAVGGVLQTHDRFAPTAAAPILLNGCIIASATFFAWRLGASMERTAFAVAWSVVGAGVLQLVWSLLALRRHMRLGVDFRGASASVRRIGRTMLPVIVGLAALQINTLFDGVIAGWPVLVGPTLALPWMESAVTYPLDESSNAVLFYAQRLYQFPLGVFGIALATAVFPALARCAASPTAYAETLRRCIRIALFIGLPASVGMIAVRTDLIIVILRGGEFAADDVARVSATLLGYAPGIWAYTLTQTLTRAFYARNDTKTPMRAALISVACNLPLNLILIWPLGEAGLAWSTSLCAMLHVALLHRGLRRDVGACLDRETLTAAGRSLLASILMGGALAVLFAFRPDGDSWKFSLLWLGLTVLGGAGVFFAGALALRLPEPKWLLHR